MGEPVVTVKVIPRSSINKIVGFDGNILKVKVKSAPVDGSANRDLIVLLSKSAKISKQKIEILSGQKSRLKRVKFYDITHDDLFGLLSR